MTRTPFAVALIATALIVPAFAQYGGPAPVVTPAGQPTTDVQAVSNRFRDVYTAHGRPRIVIFWNRSFDTQVASNYDRVVSGSSQSSRSSTTLQDQSASDEGSTTVTRSGSDAQSSFETRRGVRQSGPDSAGAQDSQDTATWEAQGAFTDLLSSVPVRLIDRATIMRTSDDAINAGNRANLQAIETKALLAKTDLVLEVGINADPASQSGYLFKVAVRDIKSGEIIIQFTTHAVPVEAGQVRYVAGPNGYERATMPITVGMLGRELAVETMQRLSQAW